MYDYTLMDLYIINFESVSIKELTIERIQEQYRKIEGQHLLVTLELPKNISLEHLHLIVSNLPNCFVGFNLLPLIANQPLEFLEKVLVSLPAHIRYLNADNLITEYLQPLSQISDQLPYDLFKQILPKVPKTILEFSFKNNLTRNLPGYLELITDYLPQIRSLDLQNNYLDQLHKNQISNLWVNLPKKTSVLLLSFSSQHQLYARDLENRDKILRVLPDQITQLILTIGNFYPNSQKELKDCFSSMSSSVKKIQWTYQDIDEPFYLVELIKHTPKSVTTLDLRDLALGPFTYPTEDNNTDKSKKLIFEIVENIPKHVSTLLLDRNELDCLTSDEFILLISLIPKTVTQISLTGNNLFTGKSVYQLEDMLEKIKPYNQSASNCKVNTNRLLLDDNGFKGKALAYPLIKIFNKDIFNEIGKYLNGPGFFQSANKECNNREPSAPLDQKKAP